MDYDKWLEDNEDDIAISFIWSNEEEILEAVKAHILDGSIERILGVKLAQRYERAIEDAYNHNPLAPDTEEEKND